ncbi:MAG: Asp-tRNA(Asn)/Glu-tRNA(Gln) amidotransferase subunit GatB [Phycisphaerae bacterium]|jgi:aspartyl-tRNA(Asn)/glutamyl-tRNA(Gln) amidotransferase subunit B
MLRLDGLRIEAIVGLEVHVQLATRTKMFCACPVEFGAPPNSRTCPVCLGLPGALPVPNRAAVGHAIRTALALNCSIADFTKWDRKNYFYPDQPKNYQITQYDLPLTHDGHFEFTLGHYPRRVRIRRVHLEEDAGKNVHDLAGGTGVDLNRAGTPLLEIVTEPDLRSAEEVRECAVQLHRLVRYLGVSEAVMQRGQMRFEPNINVRILNGRKESRTPIVEVKNLNSFHALQQAVQHEIDRQVELWRDDGVTAESGNKSNRGWDDGRGVTVPQRGKEEAHDYRYFPEPDLVPLCIDRLWVGQLKTDMPELPVYRAERYVSEYKISRREASVLVDDRATADLLDDAADAGGDKRTLAKQFLGLWARLACDRGTTIAGLGVSPGRLAELANLVCGGRLNATAGARVAEAMLANHDPPTAVAERLGVMQDRDRTRVAVWVDEALAQNERAVRDALVNPKKRRAARGYLVGQVMQASGGRADPRLVADLIDGRLKARQD